MTTIGKKMIQVISNNRRNVIKQAVYKILSNGDTPCLPVKIGTIIRSFCNVKLITYSSQIKKYNISYNELIINAETKDSYVVYSKLRNKYCIYYNDLDKNIVNSNRVRWNLAHELGHVVLKHHDICNKNKLFRDNIDDKTYLYLEDEANYFAQLILVPHAAIIGFEIRNYSSISNLCKVSNPAAKKRFYEYSKWMKNINPNDAYDNQIFKLFYPFVYKRKCHNCDAGLIQRHGNYCPICGQKSLQWGDGEMIYTKIEAHPNGKLKKCPICDNEETEIDGNFCQICNMYLVNECQYEDCDNYEQILPTNARYCPVCGKESLFLNNDILKSWNYYSKGFIHDSDDFDNKNFLEIPDGVEDEGLPFN